MPQHQLSITCGLCKHHRLLEVANLIAIVGGDTTAHEVRQRARCNVEITNCQHKRYFRRGKKNECLQGCFCPAIWPIKTYELGSSNCLSYLAVYDSLQLIKAVLAFKGLLLGPLEQAISATRPHAWASLQTCVVLNAVTWLFAC